MALLQLDIPESLNKKLKIYKIEKDFVTLADAAVDIINKGLPDKGKVRGK